MEFKGCPFDREDLGEPRDSLIHLGPLPVIKLSSSAYATDNPCLCPARFIWHLTSVKNQHFLTCLCLGLC